MYGRLDVEREITSPVDVARPDGRIHTSAIGWARHPLLRWNVARGVSRVASWNYWCVYDKDAALTLLVADVGYLGAALVSFLEYGARRPVEAIHVRPRGIGFDMPPGPDGDVAVEARRLRLATRTSGASMRIEGHARPLVGPRIAIDLAVRRAPSHETLTALIPFGETSFQLTSKHQALPAEGVVRVGAREHRFGPDSGAFACLDFGRGRWPRGTEWNWAFGATARGGRTVGVNLGGKWTEGTGVTENAIVVDGRLSKIGDAVDFSYDERSFMKPWRIGTRTTDRVRLRFVPITERVVRVPLGLAGVELHQHMGRFEGTVTDEAGSALSVDGMHGLAEWLRAWW
jgi:hypothetical protein